jgi:alpha-L-fucosidase
MGSNHTKRKENLYAPAGNSIFLPGIKEKVNQVLLMGATNKIKFKQQAEGVIISTEGITIDGPDTVIVVELK